MRGEPRTHTFGAVHRLPTRRCLCGGVGSSCSPASDSNWPRQTGTLSAACCQRVRWRRWRRLPPCRQCAQVACLLTERSARVARGCRAAESDDSFRKLARDAIELDGRTGSKVELKQRLGGATELITVCKRKAKSESRSYVINVGDDIRQALNTVSSASLRS